MATTKKQKKSKYRLGDLVIAPTVETGKVLGWICSIVEASPIINGYQPIFDAEASLYQYLVQWTDMPEPLIYLEEDISVYRKDFLEFKRSMNNEG